MNAAAERGPAFRAFDSRVCGLTMLRLGMSRAIALDAAGTILDPSSVLRKRPARSDNCGSVRSLFWISLRALLSNGGPSGCRQPRCGRKPQSPGAPCTLADRTSHWPTSVVMTPTRKSFSNAARSWMKPQAASAPPSV